MPIQLNSLKIGQVGEGGEGQCECVFIELMQLKRQADWVRAGKVVATQDVSKRCLVESN